VVDIHLCRGQAQRPVTDTKSPQRQSRTKRVDRRLPRWQAACPYHPLPCRPSHVTRRVRGNAPV
jgi:hypothetical protein